MSNREWKAGAYRWLIVGIVWMAVGVGCEVPNPNPGRRLADQSLWFPYKDLAPEQLLPCTSPPTSDIFGNRVACRTHYNCSSSVASCAQYGAEPWTMDVWYPAAFPYVPAKGVLLWVHGGAYNAGDGAGHAPGIKLAELALSDSTPSGGWIVLSIDYRGATANASPFPAAVHDVKTAIRFARKHFANPNGLKLVVAGASAGGHLSALAAVTHDTSDLEPSYYPYSLGNHALGKVDGVINLGGPMDMLPFMNYLNDHNQKPISASNYLENCLPVPDPYGPLPALTPNVFDDFREDISEFLRCSVPGSYPGLNYSRTPGVVNEPCIFTQGGEQAAQPVVAQASVSTYVTPDDPPMYVALAACDCWIPYRSACFVAGSYHNLGRHKEFWMDLVQQPTPGTPEHLVHGANSDTIDIFLQTVASGNFAGLVAPHNVPPSNDICQWQRHIPNQINPADYVCPLP